MYIIYMSSPPFEHFEAHFLERATSGLPGGKPLLKAHMLCRLHQQHLVETLLIAVAGTWVMSRLYSLTLFLKSSTGMPARLRCEFEKL